MPISRRSLILGTACSLALAMAGCRGDETSGPAAGRPSGTMALAEPADPQVNADPESATWYEDHEKLLAESSVDDGFHAALDTFSWRTATQVLTTGEGATGNADFSPISLYHALALAGVGAGGRTQQQIYDLLDATGTDQLVAQLGDLYRLMYLDGEHSTLKLADSVWIDTDARMEQDYIELVADRLYATPFQVEFGTDQADTAIGDWVGEQTAGSLTPRFQTTADMVVMLLNTVYFKDAWLEPFDASSTTQETFHAETGETTADFLVCTVGNAAYHRGEGWTRASLPFASGATMTFILPDEGVQPRQLLAGSQGAEALFAGTDDSIADITYRIPKFGFDTDYRLEGVCAELGMTDAFDDQADFSAMTPQQVLVSSIVQGTHIRLDEDGVEASAYTALSMRATSMQQPAPPLDLTLDRPFIFEIGSAQGVPLFIGICADPTA